MQCIRHVDPLNGDAHLTTVRKRVREQSVGNVVHHGIIEDDGRVVAAQLEGDTLEIRGNGGCDPLARGY